VNEKALERQGYNLIRWSNGGMTYWAVSDLNLAELQQFAQLLQQQSTAQQVQYRELQYLISQVKDNTAAN
jgi:hypothetical protein